MASTRKRKDGISVAVIGAGFGGMGMGIALKRAGIQDFHIFEAAGEVGGTWRDNTYPGVACDIPSHLYSFSFDQNPQWSRRFSPGAEIQEYLVDCARRHGLYEHITFHTAIQSATFDEVSHRWTLTTDAGIEYQADSLVMAVGPLSTPQIPDLPGLDEFQGACFHSSRWDHSLELADKRVGVVGTGASAIQIVPGIANEAAEVVVFQRTPPWVIRRRDRAYSSLEKALFTHVPGLQRAYRSFIYLRNEAHAVGLLDAPFAMRAMERLALKRLRRTIEDRETQAALTPDYSVGCKRVTLSDDYYPTLARDDVHLIPEAVASFSQEGVVTTGGREVPLDVVVLATGFKATEYLSHFSIRGRGGVDLNESWRDGAEAYYGVAVSGFPNLFLLLGPNTGLGHNSVVFMIEAQINLALQCIQEMNRRRATAIEVRPSTQRRFNDALQERLRGTVWSSGCQSWYLDKSGKNTTLWPGYTAEYWLRTRRLNREDFLLHWSRDGAP